MTLDRAILESLASAHPRLLPSRTVHADVTLSLGEAAPTLNETTAALRKLEGGGWVHGVTHPDIGARWGLTGQGQLRLAE